MRICFLHSRNERESLRKECSCQGHVSGFRGMESIPKNVTGSICACSNGPCIAKQGCFHCTCSTAGLRRFKEPCNKRPIQQWKFGSLFTVSWPGIAKHLMFSCSGYKETDDETITLMSWKMYIPFALSWDWVLYFNSTFRLLCSYRWMIHIFSKVEVDLQWMVMDYAEWGNRAVTARVAYHSQQVLWPGPRGAGRCRRPQVWDLGAFSASSEMCYLAYYWTKPRLGSILLHTGRFRIQREFWLPANIQLGVGLSLQFSSLPLHRDPAM